MPETKKNRKAINKRGKPIREFGLYRFLYEKEPKLTEGVLLSKKALEKKPVKDWTFEDLWEDATGYRPTKEETAKVFGKRPKRRRVWRHRESDSCLQNVNLPSCH